MLRPKFHRKKITSEQYLKQAITYVHLNPVHHEFVENPKDWKYSSYLTYFSSKTTNLHKNEVIELFEDLKNFKAYHKMKTADIYASKMELDY